MTKPKFSLYGQSSNFWTDVKSDIKAGMPFNGSGNNKITTVGYQITRTYFDSPNKDWTIGYQVVKRVIYK